jgi:FixJ family two-component response regulator
VNASKPIIFVVDDDASFRTAISRLLHAAGYSFRTFASATEFLQAPPTGQPGCIIVDLHMPGPSGLDLQTALAKTESPLPLIFLTGHGDISASVQAIKQGAEDFLTKPVTREKLLEAVQRALAREAQERARRTRQRELRARFELISAREREVLALVISGRLNKQIAGDLNVCERTVKAHRASLMTKLQVQSSAELGSLAQEMGFHA